MNEPPRAYIPLGTGGMSQHNVTAGFGAPSQPLRVPAPSVPRWEVAPNSAAASLAKSAPMSNFIPSLTTQMAPMQALGFDYTAPAHQPRYPPPIKPDYYTTPRYSDPSSYIPASGIAATYPYGGEMEGWGLAMPAIPRSPTKKSKNQKKADGKQATFLTKLYQLLEDPQHHHIIRWDETGTLIIIERPEELAEKILPQVYRQTRFASFSRQLNIYGWMRKVSLRHVDNTGIVDPDASTWSHQTLRRDSSKEDIQGFRRRVPPRPSQAQKNAARLAETMSHSSDSSDFHSPPGYTAHNLGDLNEPKAIDLSVNAIMPGSDASGALHTFNLDPTGPGVGPSVGGSEALQARRLSMPASTRPSLSFQMHRPLHLKQNSMPSVHGPSGLSSSFSQAYPMSMPPNTLQIVDGSGRPMATNPQPPNMFSPSTGLGSLFIGDDGKDDLLLQGTNEAPSFKVEDPSTWARRGTGTLGDGLRPTEPAPLNSPFPAMHFFTSPIDSASQVFQPGLPGSGMSTQPLIAAPSKTAQPTLTTSPVPTSTQLTDPSASVGGSGPTATPVAQSQGSLLSTVAQTVSPGVYQTGFALQAASWMSPRGTPSPPTASRSAPSMAGPASVTATATKSERRQSLTHPYSPPHTRAALAPPGNVRHIGMARSRDSISMTINTSVAGVRGGDDDGALPSASLAQPELFAGEIEAKPDLERLE